MIGVEEVNLKLTVSQSVRQINLSNVTVSTLKELKEKNSEEEQRLNP